MNLILSTEITGSDNPRTLVVPYKQRKIYCGSSVKVSRMDVVSNELTETLVAKD